MADVEVTCITKPHPQSRHEHITHLGNPAANWKWTREQIIASIEAKTNTFYVLDPYSGKRSDIGVVHPGGGRVTVSADVRGRRLEQQPPVPESVSA
jgi:Protein of unknown function (DUF3892)